MGNSLHGTFRVIMLYQYNLAAFKRLRLSALYYGTQLHRSSHYEVYGTGAQELPIMGIMLNYLRGALLVASTSINIMAFYIML